MFLMVYILHMYCVDLEFSTSILNKVNRISSFNSILKLVEMYEKVCSGFYCAVLSHKNLKLAFKGEENLTLTNEQMLENLQ